MTARVVAEAGADRLRHAGQVAHQRLRSAREQIRMPLEQFLRIVDVGLVMLRVVNLHRLRVDVRLERIIGESQLGQVPSEGGSGGRGVGCGGLGQAEAGDHRAGPENFQRLAAGHGGIIAIIHAWQHVRKPCQRKAGRARPRLPALARRATGEAGRAG